MRRLKGNGLIALIVLVAVAIPGSVVAQGFTPRERVLPFSSGIWFDPAFSGSGWTTAWLDIPSVPSGRFGAFAFYTYDTAGRATWLQFNQPYEVAPTSAFVAGTSLGSMRGPFFAYTGGPCPTCPFSPATGAASPIGEAQLTWVSPTVFEARYGGVTRRVRAAELEVATTISALLTGEWDGVVSGPFGVGECAVRILPGARPARDDRFERAGPDVRDVPTAGGEWFEILDIDTNPGSCAPTGARLQVTAGTDQIVQWPLVSQAAITDPANPATVIGYRISNGAISRWYLQTPKRIVVHQVFNSVSASTIEQEIVFTKR